LLAPSCENILIVYGTKQKATKLKMTIFGIPKGSMPKLGRKKILVNPISPMNTVKGLNVFFTWQQYFRNVSYPLKGRNPAPTEVGTGFRF
jgi:hypothetical protein